MDDFTIPTLAQLIARIQAAGRHAGAAGDYDMVPEIAAQGVRLIFVGTKSLIEPGARAYREMVSRAGK